MSAVSFCHFDGVQYSLKRKEQISSFHLPPDKLYNNHSVSRLPPGLRIQFCLFVPRQSHELTLRFCSGQGESDLQGPLDSLLLKVFLKGWTIIQQPRYPSLPAPCSSALTVLPCMSNEDNRSLQASVVLPLIIFTSYFLRHWQWPTRDSFVLVNMSLNWKWRSSSAQEVEFSAASFIWDKEWDTSTDSHALCKHKK